MKLFEELNFSTYKNASKKFRKIGHHSRADNIDDFILSRGMNDEQEEEKENKLKTLGEIQLKLKNGNEVTIKPENIRIFTTEQRWDMGKVYIALFFDKPENKINLSARNEAIKIILPNGKLSKVKPKVTTGSPKMDKTNMDELPSNRKDAIKLYQYLIKLSEIIIDLKDIIISKSYDAHGFQRSSAIRAIKNIDKYISINDLYTV